MTTGTYITWDSPQAEIRKHAAEQLRQFRAENRPPLPSDGSVGQYGAWTELLCRAITAPDQPEDGDGPST